MRGVLCGGYREGERGSGERSGGYIRLEVRGRIGPYRPLDHREERMRGGGVGSEGPRGQRRTEGGQVG